MAAIISPFPAPWAIGLFVRPYRACGRFPRRLFQAGAAGPQVYPLHGIHLPDMPQAIGKGCRRPGDTLDVFDPFAPRAEKMVMLPQATVETKAMGRHGQLRYQPLPGEKIQRAVDGVQRYRRDARVNGLVDHLGIGMIHPAPQTIENRDPLASAGKSRRVKRFSGSFHAIRTWLPTLSLSTNDERLGLQCPVG